jgi:hypothetical protein
MEGEKDARRGTEDHGMLISQTHSIYMHGIYIISIYKLSLKTIIKSSTFQQYKN